MMLMVWRAILVLVVVAGCASSTRVAGHPPEDVVELHDDRLHGVGTNEEEHASPSSSERGILSTEGIGRALVTIPPAADYLFYEPLLFGTYMTDAVTSLGKTWVAATAEQFGAMTTADFRRYKAIVFADPACFGPVLAEAIGDLLDGRATWSDAIDGNVVVIGTDEVYHWAAIGNNANFGGDELALNALRFAAGAAGSTGLYFSLSCSVDSLDPVPLTILDNVANITVATAPDGLNNLCHVVADHPISTNLTDDLLSNWDASLHEVITSYPPNFDPVAIATDIGNTTYADGSMGTPYIIARTVAICGNGVVEGREECDDGNNADGDGCSSTCQCSGTTYWLWNPKNETVVRQIMNNTALCLNSTYNIEVRPCPTPTPGVAVKMTLKSAATSKTLRRYQDYASPYFLWGDNMTTGNVYPNSQPIPARDGTFWLHSNINGNVEKVKFKVPPGCALKCQKGKGCSRKR